MPVQAAFTDQSYRQEILRDRPVLYLPLDRTGIAVDFRPTASPLNLSVAAGAPKLTGGISPGSSAALFDGASNYAIPYASAASLRGTDMSLSVWARNDGATNNPLMVGNADGSTGWLLYCFSNVNSNYYLAMQGLDNVLSGAPGSPGRFDHIGVIMKAGAGTAMWFNGRITPYLSPFTQNNNASANFTVGGTFLGGLAHLAIYNYALPTARLVEHYKAGLRLKSQSLPTRAIIRGWREQPIETMPQPRTEMIGV